MPVETGTLGEARRPARADRHARRAEPVRPGRRRRSRRRRRGSRWPSAAEEARRRAVQAAASSRRTEHETAQLDYANAQSALVSARTRTSTSPSSVSRTRRCARRSRGTIIEKTVSLGTGHHVGDRARSAAARRCSRWPTSARCACARCSTRPTSVRSQPGQTATVTVDAYPDRRFVGIVEKIEPQAVVQQSVTMFPVLVTLAEPRGAAQARA